jgi:hypothetical protein
VCIGKSDFKKIDDSIDKPFYDRMHARLQTVSREKTRRIRSSTVEPVLGTLVNYLAMRRVNTRGIKQASKCMLMAAVAYNLKKLLKWEGKKIKVMAIAKMKEVKNTMQNLVFSLLSFLELRPSL